MAEWFETFFEDLWLRQGDRAGEAEFLRKALRLRKGQSVLDAPCGDGGVAVHLARRGIRVTGVDLVPRFIARARRRFARQKLPGEFRVLDMRRIDYEGQFHAAYNWFGSFGYFSDAENLDVLRRLARSLRPGGRLLIDQPNREFILRHFRRRQRRGDVTTTVSWRPETRRVDAVWSLRRAGRTRRCRSSMRLYTPAEFRRMFDQAGLAVAEMFGSREGGAHHRGSRRLLVVGRRTASRS